MSYESPDTDDMDMMNDVRARFDREEDLLREAYQMLNPDNKFRKIPTMDHVKILIREIENLKTQIKLANINWNLQ